jgi:hypothetical protein
MTMCSALYSDSTRRVSIRIARRDGFGCCLFPFYSSCFLCLGGPELEMPWTVAENRIVVFQALSCTVIMFLFL